MSTRRVRVLVSVLLVTWLAFDGYLVYRWIAEDLEFGRRGMVKVGFIFFFLAGGLFLAGPLLTLCAWHRRRLGSVGGWAAADAMLAVVGLSIVSSVVVAFFFN